MDPTLLSSVLLVVGIVCLLLEIKIPGFFIAIPGTAMLLLGAVGLMMPWLLLSAASPLIALTGAVAASALSIRFYKRLGPPSAPPITSHPQGLVGETGVVVRDIDGVSLRGRVKIGGQIWSSTAVEPTPAGTLVLVLGTDGDVLVVGEPPEELRRLGPSPQPRLGPGNPGAPPARTS
jgi:inner membrane protein